MSEIRINRLNGQLPHQKQVKKEENEKTLQENTKKPEVNHKNADEVLSFLANSSQLEKAKTTKGVKKIEVSKYVNKEQAERISQSVKMAFGAMLEYEEAFIKEFGLPKDAAEDAAIMAFGQRYLV